MYCENQNCRRTGLSKAEVEKDHKSGLLLCLGCYALANPEWRPQEQPVMGEIIPMPTQIPPGPQLGFSVTLDSFRGLSAQLSYGSVSLEVIVPQRAISGFLNGR